jgi:hypothetical protein
MEKESLSKELLPPVFGSKLKVVCISCKQLSLIVNSDSKTPTINTSTSSFSNSNAGNSSNVI